MEQLLDNAKITHEYIDEIELKISFDKNKSFRSICKTALEYYLFKGGKEKYIKQLIPYIQEKSDLNVVNFYYPIKKVDNTNEYKNISHSILIKGNKNKKLLYAYIEFFNAYKFIVLLNNNYDGKNFTDRYCYDVVKRKLIDNNIEINLDLNEITNILNDKELYFSELKKHFAKLLNFISQKNSSERINDIITNAIKEMENKFSKEKYKYCTEEMLHFLSNKVADNFVVFMNQTHRID